MVVGFIYYIILLLYPLYTCEQLYHLQQLLLLGVFAKLHFQAVFFQAVTYSFLDILQRCFQYQHKSISNFLRVFLLIKFLCGVSLASQLYYSINIKGDLYRYIIYSYYLYIFYPIKLQLVYKYFLYKYQVDYTFLGPSFSGRFASQGN